MNLREALREVLGREVTDADVARASGFSRPYVNQLLNAARTPPSRTLNSVLRSLHLSEQQADDVLRLTGVKEWDPEAALLKGLSQIRQTLELTESTEGMLKIAGLAGVPSEWSGRTPGQVREALRLVRAHFDRSSASRATPTAAGIQAPPSMRDLFWRRYGQAAEDLAREGVQILPLALDEASARWDEKTEADIDAWIERIKERSRKYS
jgi:transcriptional regulator with XRE-family HTH domain